MFILLILLLLSGCVGYGNWSWQHPQGLGELERQQAIAECEAIATEEINRHDYLFPYPRGYFFPYYYNRHNYRDSRYYYLPRYYLYDGHSEYQDRKRYFRICMKSKGWRMVQAPLSQPLK